jgi:hypothetical protein
MSAYVSTLQHTSAYGSIRQHTSAFVSIRRHMHLLALHRENGAGDAPGRVGSALPASVERFSYVQLYQRLQRGLVIEQATRLVGSALPASAERFS